VEGANVKRDEFTSTLEKEDTKLKPPKFCERTAFLEAVRSVKAKTFTYHLLIRTILKSKEEHLFGLVDESINQQQKSLGYTHQATLRWGQESYTITCDKKHRAFDMIQERFNENKDNLNSYELRRWIMNVIEKWRNISVRDKGGIYYIDVKYEKELFALESILNATPGITFSLVPLPDIDRSKKAIYKAFMEDLQHKMQKFRESIKNEKYSSNKGWSNALKKFKELREEVGFYADRLQFNAKSLQDQLDVLQKDVKKKLVD